jgi:hypothetical protein
MHSPTAQLEGEGERGEEKSLVSVGLFAVALAVVAEDVGAVGLGTVDCEVVRFIDL